MVTVLNCEVMLDQFDSDTMGHKQQTIKKTAMIIVIYL
jgi:hypothetical protein